MPALPPPGDPRSDPSDVTAPDGLSVRLSALLHELAAVPPEAYEEAWQKGVSPGEQVGKFLLGRELGRGGFGVVFEARDLELGRAVAFKALRRQRLRPDVTDDWLEREALALAKLHQHPHIVTLYDLGHGPTGPFLIFELLRGETLERRLRRGPLPVREALGVARGVAAALAHAHAARVLHRDLKPSNVYCCADGTAKVLDFGLAHLFEAGGEGTGGTPAYMAPEHWRRAPGDERSDLFSLGVMLHEMLAGEPPYAVTAAHSAALEPGPVPRLPVRSAPARLRRLTARLIAKDPARRPASAVEVQRALAAIQPARRWTLAAAVAAVAAAAWLSYPPARPPLRLVAVADVENRSGAPAAAAISGLLVNALEPSRLVKVMGHTDLADHVVAQGRRRPEVVDEGVGLEAARAAGASALVVLSAQRDEEGFRVVLRSVDPVSGATEFKLEERAPDERGLGELAVRLADRIRGRMRERREEIRVSPSASAKVNPEAAQYYFAGEQILTRGNTSELRSDWAEARELFRRAAEIDPGYAMAHYQVAYTYWTERRRPEAGQAIAQAKAHLDSLPARERARLLALDDLIAGRIPEAKARYQELLGTWPDDRTAALDLSRMLMSREAGKDLAGAAVYARLAVDLAPRSATAWEELLGCLALRGDHAQLLEDARRYARAVPTASAHEWIGHALLALGRYAEAEQAFRRAADLFGPVGLMGMAAVRVRMGDLDGAERHYRALAADPDPAFREGLYGLSWVSAYRGRYTEAARRLDEVVQLDLARRDRPDAARALGQQALWLTLATGRFAEEPVRRGQETLSEPGDLALLPRHFYWFAVQAALAAGRLDRAEALEEEASRFGSTHTASLVRMARARAEGRMDDARREARAVRDPDDLTYGFHLALAEWELEAGLRGAAREQATRAMILPVWSHPDAVGFRASIWPRALLVRARVHLANGDSAAARADLDELLAIWSEADAEAPAVAEARALRRQLRSR